MLIKKLKLQGFKSFAQPTNIEFSTNLENKCGITAIVGPNGCGKSNVVEAIRWALGEQSLKALRGKKSTDVIFHGSEKKARLGMAKISLYFDNQDQSMPIDYSEVIISRQIFRNGDSEYSINGNKTRLIDILDLLAKANFGQRSYSIISQGQIMTILLSSAINRKIFFEEATGVRMHTIKREETIRKITRTKENLQRVNITLQELKPRVNSLTRQVNKLAKQDKIKDTLLILQKQYYSKIWNKIKKECEITNENWQKARFKHQTLSQQIKENQEKINQLINLNEQTKPWKKLEEDYQQLITQKNELSQQESFLYGQIVSIQQQSTLDSEEQTEINIPSQNIQQTLIVLKNIKQEQEKLINSLSNIKDLNELSPLIKLADKIKNEITDLINPKQTRTQAPTPQKNKQENKLLNDLLKQRQLLKEQIKQLNAQIEQVKTKINQSQLSEDKERQKTLAQQTKWQEQQNDFNRAIQQTNEIKIDLTRIETRKQVLEEEIYQELSLMPDQLPILKQPINQEEILAEIDKLKYALQMIGNIDPSIDEEYNECSQRYQFLNTQSVDLKKANSSLNQIIKKLDQKIEKQFRQNFSKINQRFQHYFTILFGGGKAKLIFHEQEVNQSDGQELDVDSYSKTKSVMYGIDILVNPPGKRSKNIETLSGGEKTLTALALICAIISTNTPPFVILDEVDAALDESNSSKFANILESLSNKTQFIVITHNRGTMQKANALYGITMGNDGISKLYSLKLESEFRPLLKEDEVQSPVRDKH
ncbi:MAG: AAA family ATPase [Candidatus Aenigmarchaeota archaeon]|nr:AAA family ATPase [Candidatus Aenigmarchaeota archaeon]